MNPKISIIIPVYNVEDLLRETLDTCVKQELKEIEFICVNDGSSDSSLSILKEYAAKDQRFVIIDKENGGVSEARNFGLRKAKGDWIMFLDADDLLEEDACLKVLKNSEKKLADGSFPEIIVSHSDVFPVAEEAKRWYEDTLHFDEAEYQDFHPDVLFEQKGSLPYIWCQAFKRELFERSKVLFDEDLKIGEDAVFLMKIYPWAKGFLFTSDKTYNYRINRKGSAMEDEQKEKDKMAENHIEIVKRSAKYWSENGLFDKYALDFLKWTDRFLTPRLYKTDKSSRHKRANQIYNEIMVPYGFDKLYKKLTFKRKCLWYMFRAARII